jgi:hypothetical protein
MPETARPLWPTICEQARQIVYYVKVLYSTRFCQTADSDRLGHELRALLHVTSALRHTSSRYQDAWSASSTRYRYGRLGGRYRLHIQDRRVNYARNLVTPTSWRWSHCCPRNISVCLQIAQRHNSEDRTLYIQITLHSSSHAPPTHRHMHETS